MQQKRLIVKKADLSDDEIRTKIKDTVCNYAYNNANSICNKFKDSFSYTPNNTMFIDQVWYKIKEETVKYWQSNIPKLRSCLKSVMNPKSARYDSQIKDLIYSCINKAFIPEKVRQIILKYKPTNILKKLPVSKEIFINKMFFLDLKTWLLDHINEVLPKVGFNGLTWYDASTKIKTEVAMNQLFKWLIKQDDLLNTILKKYNLTVQDFKQDSRNCSIEEICNPIKTDISIKLEVQYFNNIISRRSLGIDEESREQILKMHAVNINSIEDLDDDDKINKPGPVINFDPWNPSFRDAPLILARKFNDDRTNYKDVVLIGKKGQHHMPMLNEYPDVRDHLFDSQGKEVFTCGYVHDLICFLSNREYNGYSSIDEVAKLIKEIEPTILKVYLQPDNLPGNIVRKANKKYK